MADTILILGNGFDLAMKRKTSYEHFVEFANNLLPITDIQLKKFIDENNINIEKYEYNYYLRFINENRSTLGKNWCNLENMISQLAEAIDYFKLNADILYREDKNSLKVPHVDLLEGSIVSQENFASKLFIAKIFYELFYFLKWDKLERRVAISELTLFSLSSIPKTIVFISDLLLLRSISPCIKCVFSKEILYSLFGVCV